MGDVRVERATTDQFSGSLIGYHIAFTNLHLRSCTINRFATLQVLSGESTPLRITLKGAGKDLARRLVLKPGPGSSRVLDMTVGDSCVPTPSHPLNQVHVRIAVTLPDYATNRVVIGVRACRATGADLSVSSIQ
jgi:hypothetical protein